MDIYKKYLDYFFSPTISLKVESEIKKSDKFIDNFEKDIYKYLDNIGERIVKNPQCIQKEISGSFEANPHINVMLSSIHCESDDISMVVSPKTNSQNKVIIDKDFSPIPYSMKMIDKKTNTQILEMNYPVPVSKEHMRNFILSSSNQNNQPTKN